MADDYYYRDRELELSKALIDMKAANKNVVALGVEAKLPHSTTLTEWDSIVTARASYAAERQKLIGEANRAIARVANLLPAAMIWFRANRHAVAKLQHAADNNRVILVTEWPPAYPVDEVYDPDFGVTSSIKVTAYVTW